MRDGQQQAKPDVGRPLDGRVRRHAVAGGWAARGHDLVVSMPNSLASCVTGPAQALPGDAFASSAKYWVL